MLVAVVGATFAYFTATTKTDGEGASASITTSNLGGTNFNFNSAASHYELLNYPGGLGIYGATAELKKAESVSDTNDYEATFDLKITYTNKTNTDLDWELYVVDDEVTLDSGEFAATTTCELKSAPGEAGKTKYWYADTTDAETDDQRCDAEAIKNKVTSDLHGEMIAHGQFPNVLTNSGEGTIDKNTEQGNLLTDATNNLGNRKLYTKSAEGKASKKTYYLVVKYPNKGDQSTDAGAKISVNLAVDGTPQAVLESQAE